MSERRTPRIYLAGPEVFLADAVEIGARKKAICAAHGLEGLYPLDGEIDIAAELSRRAAATRIYDANIALLERADGVIANVTPFLGALADDGTAFEIGFAVARRLPIALYDNGAGDTAAKAAALLAAAPSLADPAVTAEDFGMEVNLMLAIPAGRSVGLFAGEAARPLADLERFEQACAALAKALGDLSS